MKIIRLSSVIFLLALISFLSCSSENLSGKYASFWRKARKIDLIPANVVDGDTFKIGKNSFRVVGIDAPEIHNGDKPIGEFGEVSKRFFEDFTRKFKEGYILKGKDRFGRSLAYLFAKDGTYIYFYEASVTELGLARPLIYEEDSIKELIDDVVKSYKKAWKNRRGIFSRWENAPIVSYGDSWKDKIGKIVWLEDHIVKVFETHALYIAKGDFSSVVARKEGYKLMFKNFDFYSLEGKNIRVYGELWEYDGHPEIMVRAPFEIVFFEGGKR